MHFKILKVSTLMRLSKPKLRTKTLSQNSESIYLAFLRFKATIDFIQSFDMPVGSMNKIKEIPNKIKETGNEMREQMRKKKEYRVENWVEIGSI